LRLFGRLLWTSTLPSIWFTHLYSGQRLPVLSHLLLLCPTVYRHSWLDYQFNATPLLASPQPDSLSSRQWHSLAPRETKGTDDLLLSVLLFCVCSNRRLTTFDPLIHLFLNSHPANTHQPKRTSLTRLARTVLLILSHCPRHFFSYISRNNTPLLCTLSHSRTHLSPAHPEHGFSLLPALLERRLSPLLTFLHT
jgi:hypothetical protein